jgi:uncharacterized protein with gpF-like domain
MEETMLNLQKYFVIKKQNSINDFLGYNVIVKNNRVNLFQKSVYKNMEDFLDSKQNQTNIKSLQHQLSP